MMAKLKELFQRTYAWSLRKGEEYDNEDLKMYGPRILAQQKNENNVAEFKSHDTSQLMRDSSNDAELKVARFMLYFSVSVLCSKIYFGNRKMFDMWSAKLLSLSSAVWQLAVELKWFVIPFLSGLLVTYVTWVVIYYDSKVPGVQPPSPFNASKTAGRRWHSCYIAAVANGLIFFIILLLLYQ